MLVCDPVKLYVCTMNYAIGFVCPLFSSLIVGVLTRWF
jgi:hypothetical protein